MKLIYKSIFLSLIIVLFSACGAKPKPQNYATVLFYVEDNESLQRPAYLYFGDERPRWKWDDGFIASLKNKESKIEYLDSSKTYKVNMLVPKLLASNEETKSFTLKLKANAYRCFAFDTTDDGLLYWKLRGDRKMSVFYMDTSDDKCQERIEKFQKSKGK